MKVDACRSLRDFTDYLGYLKIDLDPSFVIFSMAAGIISAKAEAF
jgi:hypothetical protein